MHTVFGIQFRHRALALHGLQCNAGLEPSVMVPAFLHVLISSLLETSRLQTIASVTVRFSGRNSGATEREYTACAKAGLRALGLGWEV
jgi:hypothetical protein